MGERRLDLDAPLLSVRRIAAKAGQRPKAVGSAGLIPFTWEQSPGKPKGPTSSRPLAAPKLPPGRTLPENDDGEKLEEGGEDQDEVLSRNDSSLDCSVSGCSGSLDVDEHSVSFFKDPEVCQFMMGRFLPAAKAMATGPLEASSPKEHQLFSAEKMADVNFRRSPVHLPFQHRPNLVSKFACDQEEIGSYVDGDEDEDEGYGSAGPFSRACGLIPHFCLKSSFLLLNPVPGMKVRSPLPPRSLTNSDHGSLASAPDESWDAVYKHKTGHRDDPLEDWSKFTSESNRLTCWSDSQTPDESSYHHSPHSPVLEGKGSLGVIKRELKGRKTMSFDWCERVGEKYGKLRTCHSKGQGPGSMIPSVDGILYEMNTMETPSSESRSVDAVADAADENSSVLVDGRRMEDNHVVETSVKDKLEPNMTASSEGGLPSISENSGTKGTNCSNDDKLTLKVEDEGKSSGALALSLLPPPPPKSPSESWLQRTLPSASTKYPSSQSFLGIQVQHRKQASWASSKDFQRGNDVGSVKRQAHQTRFAQVLKKDAVLQCEP